MRTNVAFLHPTEFVPVSDDEGILATSGAQWFVSLLRSIPGLQIDDELCQEDWGVVIFTQRNQKRFWIGLSMWPDGKHAWLAHVHHGSFAWLQRFRPSGKTELKRLLWDIHKMLASEPVISGIIWYEERELATQKPDGYATPNDAYLDVTNEGRFVMHNKWPPMQNLLLEDIEYQTEETPLGTWWRFVYPNGQLFAEFVSHRQIFGLPLIHYTYGRCPETGKRIVARGVIAIGRLAVGVVAIGQASAGLVAIGQLAIGLIFGLGQATTGVFCIGQLALGLIFGLGQFATGHVAIGQIAFGHYVLAQIGWGTHVLDTRQASPIARQFFETMKFW